MTRRLLGLVWLLLLAGNGSVAAQTPFIELDLPLKEGDVKITGRSNLKRVIVRVYSGWTTTAAQQQREAISDARRNAVAARAKIIDEARERGEVDRAQGLECLRDDPVSTAGPVTVEKNAFEVLLKQRLNGGDCVVVQDADVHDDTATTTSAIAKSVVLDLGRLRGYFSIGAAVSQHRSNFSQVDTFVGFTNDSRIGGNLVVKYVCIATAEQLRGNPSICKDKNLQRPAQGPLALRDFRWHINAITDASVGFRLATTGATTTTPSVATGGQPAQAPFQRPDQLVFNSEQPGFFQIGIHMPLSTKAMDWRNDGKLYSFFFAPIYKWGVQAFDSSTVVKRVVDIDLTKPATDTARFKTTSEDLRRGALPFWGTGIRMGIYHYELLGKELRQRQIANDPVAYFDITWGKATAFRSYQFTRAVNDAKTVETVTIDSTVRPRLAMEGRLKVPYLPALVGVDINVRSATGDQEPNEFRFIAAFRIDAQKALGRIFRSDALSADK